MEEECIICANKGPFGFEQIGTTFESQHRTLMECIITCVPNMAHVINPDDLICPICKVKLLNAVKFYEQCSEALIKLEARRNDYTINLEGPSSDTVVYETPNLQSEESYFDESENEVDYLEYLREKYGLNHKLPSEGINLDCTTETPLTNVEDTKPRPQIFQVFVKQEQNRNKTFLPEEMSIDNIDILTPQMSLTESQPQIEGTSSEVNWFSSGLIKFKQPFEEWSPEENNPVFLSCSGLEDDLFKLSIHLDKAGVDKVFLAPMRPSVQKRIIFLGSLNVTGSNIKPKLTAEELGFTCIHCGSLCGNEHTYKMHYYGVHKKQCPYCSKFKVRSMSMLKRHYDRVHVQNQKCFKCEKCNQSFKNEISYENHVDQYVDTANCYFECNQCQERFKIKSAFEAHLEGHNNPKICEICSKEFKNKSLLSSHIRNVHMEKTLCPICGKLYSNVQLHMREHKKRELTFPCDQCSKIFKSNNSLKIHKRSQHAPPDAVKPYCALCDRTFAIGYSMKTHTELYHNKKAKFECEICKEQMVRKDYWRRHMAMHVKHGTEWRQVIKRGLDTRQHKNENKDKVVKKVKVVKKEKTEDKDKIKKPKPKGKYISSAPVLCNICNKVVNAGTYKSHYNKHLNYRPFQCSRCPMRFIYKQTVKRHEKLHDDPTYNLTCRICYKKFENEDLLGEHLKKHESKQQYSCDICDKKFGRAYILEMHKVNDHAEEEEEKKAILDNMLKEVVRVIPEQEIDEYIGNSKIECLSRDVTAKQKKCLAIKKISNR